MGTANILELQDNGYKSTVSAISEIIDNSIQANAKKIEVVIIRNTTRDQNEIDEVLIVDDGDGMDALTFDKALQMSSGSRSKAKSGLGKYGQGLPNASISQTKRVEVYTIQNDNILFNHIDLDEIYESGLAYLPDTESKTKIEIPLISKGKFTMGAQGTIVRWVSPNRIRPKTARTLSNHIEQVVGRTFRKFLVGFTDRDGIYYKTKISVIVYDYNGHNFELDNFTSIESIKPFDPMFLMPNTQMNSLFPESNHPTSEVYNEGIKKIFKVEHDGGLIETEVEIKLSYCKKEERERYGRNAGDTPFGRKYLHRNLVGTSGYNNISIIRAGREIDFGNFGFISDVSDTKVRWWSAEIIVEPVIDSIIGVDNKKQQAANIQYLDQSFSDSEDYHEILRWISLFLDENIKQVKKIIDKQLAEKSTNPGNTEGKIKLPPGSDTESGDPVQIDGELSDNERNQIYIDFYNWLKSRYVDLTEEEINNIIEYALSMSDNHIFVKSDLGDTQLYSYKVYGTKVLIEINYTHSFYRRFIAAFEEGNSNEKSLRSIRLLISAMVNAEIVNKTNDNSLINDRRRLRNRMFESLDDYIEELYS
jgi:hypothetical protein